MCSENKGADQLRGHNAADLHFCFCICKNRLSHDAAHMILDNAICDAHLLPHENRGGVVLIYIHNDIDIALPECVCSCLTAYVLIIA